MSEELLPCPFCGGEAHHAGGAGHHCVRCSECGVTNERIPDSSDGWCHAYDSRDDAARAWNARAAVTDEQFAQAVHDGRAWEPARTCRDFGGEEGTNGEGYDFACSACGWCGDVTEPNYCQNCGAKVVGECER